MLCDVTVFVSVSFIERVTCSDVFGLNLLDTVSESPPHDAISVCIILQTQLCAQGAAVLTVCLRLTVHVPSSSGSSLTATKPLLIPPSRVSFQRITLANIIQEFLILCGSVDYFNFCVNKSSPFVPGLSYPNPQPIYLRSFSKLLSHQ
jgi:hypothetical protein